MKLQKQVLDIIQLVKGIAASFESLAVRKGITFEINTSEDSLIGNFDRDAVEKIVTNLLSNAFKFTSESGIVSLSLRGVFSTTKQSVRGEENVPLTNADVIPAQAGIHEMSKGIDSRQEHSGMTNSLGANRNSIDSIEITVTDTGIGIPSDQMVKIFDRFYQIDDTHTREQEGTGIGLSLTKELVELHGGAISVSSEINKGSAFTVQLPLEFDPDAAVEETIRRSAHQKEGERAVPSYTDIAETIESEAVAEFHSSLSLLLIIEDNADMRRYIRTNIESTYRIEEAVNGEEGVAKAIETVPDLIISDVMMPKMDGFEVCRTLKTDQRTSHIPIILLTAKAGQEHKVEGLETGADDYMIKPFDANEMFVRVKNLIDVRRTLHEHYKRELVVQPAGVHVNSADEKFLKHVFVTIDKNFSDPGFDIERFAEESAMSRVQLHRKLKAISGYSPGEFIRNVRLQRAAELLKKRAGTVSEIAYQVGFNHLSNFAKLFHEKYGVNPSEYS
ncbi:MAG: response regulator [Ignavibacteriales bacterium]|nr:response regulator [Ignavibacteriales bacterium]